MTEENTKKGDEWTLKNTDHIFRKCEPLPWKPSMSPNHDHKLQFSASPWTSSRAIPLTRLQPSSPYQRDASFKFKSRFPLRRIHVFVLTIFVQYLYKIAVPLTSWKNIYLCPRAVRRLQIIDINESVSKSELISFQAGLHHVGHGTRSTERS